MTGLRAGWAMIVIASFLTAQSCSTIPLFPSTNKESNQSRGAESGQELSTTGDTNRVPPLDVELLRLQRILTATEDSLHLKATPVEVNPIIIDTGTASWYGDRFHGKKTASGERYNMWACTAAHRTILLGKQVRVRCDNDTNRSVIIKINDRGPHIKGRILDLSRGAWKALGLDEKQGLKKVTIEELPIMPP